MTDIYYRLANGAIWDVQKAEWLSPDEASILEAAHNINMVSENSDADAIREDQAPEMEQGGIIDLATAEGQSDVAYLAKTLAFYGYPLGELVIYSVKGIKETLKKLDDEYLTPRTLAGLSTGDTLAISRWQEHEEKAAPLRERLSELAGE